MPSLSAPPTKHANGEDGLLQNGPGFETYSYQKLTTLEMALHHSETMRVQTAEVKDNGSSILLMLSLSEELLAEQAWVIARLPGQVPVSELHITLRPTLNAGQAYPLPPAFVDFYKEPRFVSDGKKASVYLPVMEASQQELARYVSALEEKFGGSQQQEENRIFHVSLTNLVGAPNESVAHVWEYSSEAL